MATDATAASRTTGYADVNGVNLYYEVHGEPVPGTVPLVALHGGLGSGEMFAALLPDLGRGRQVILPDLQGHGRTADVDRPISVATMGDDIAALIRYLAIEHVDLFGYSLGGGVAFQVASNHPDLVRRLVLLSTNLRRTAIYAEMLGEQAKVGAASAEFLKRTPMYQLYERVAPRPEDFPRLLDKMGASMANDFDFSDEARALTMPTMFAAADADMFPPSHAVEVFALLDGGHRDGGWMGESRPRGGHALAILPGVQHYNALESPALVPAVLAFLEAPDPT
jgi:pimeloyl-ACP methyl ester carboxylesterase